MLTGRLRYLRWPHLKSHILSFSGCAWLVLSGAAGCSRDVEKKRTGNIFQTCRPLCRLTVSPKTLSPRTVEPFNPRRLGWWPEKTGSDLSFPRDRQGEGGGAVLRNPIGSSPSVVARGEDVYARYCVPCHGPQGAGDGLVTRKFPRPPALTAPHAQGLSDGQIFHIITHGQGVMPAHGAQVRERDRWVLVHHIRGLQQKRQERVQ